MYRSKEKIADLQKTSAHYYELYSAEAKKNNSISIYKMYYEFLMKGYECIILSKKDIDFQIKLNTLEKEGWVSDHFQETMHDCLLVKHKTIDSSNG